MARYTLNDLESLTGIKADTIRIWELRYKILQPHRTATNRRWYTDDDLEKLLNIITLYRTGMKVSRIAALSDDDLAIRAASVAVDNKAYDEIMGRMIIAMNNLDENGINEIINKSVIDQGLEATFTGLVFPFLHKVGVMWHTGSIDPGTEHFITTIFRNKLITAVSGISLKPVPGKRKFMFFLPEGEWHELGLLFYAWIVRIKGHEILYLGQSTPLESVISAAGAWKPDVVITGALTKLPLDNPASYLRKLRSELGKTDILAAGVLAAEAEKLKLAGLYALNSPEDLRLY
jgi:DNA-binding transcriptional MerR regulator